MTYTIASGKSFNMVLSHPEDTDPSTWSQETAVDDMKHHFAGWDFRLAPDSKHFEVLPNRLCASLTKIIGMIDKTMKWPLLSGKPLSKWVAPSGKCFILGDAAHAMVPYMSQGALAS
jgi:salicylate hydroxylase